MNLIYYGGSLCTTGYLFQLVDRQDEDKNIAGQSGVIIRIVLYS